MNPELINRSITRTIDDPYRSTDMVLPPVTQISVVQKYASLVKYHLFNDTVLHRAAFVLAIPISIIINIYTLVLMWYMLPVAAAIWIIILPAIIILTLLHNSTVNNKNIKRDFLLSINAMYITLPLILYISGKYILNGNSKK